VADGYLQVCVELARDRRTAIKAAMGVASDVPPEGHPPCSRHHPWVSRVAFRSGVRQSSWCDGDGETGDQVTAVVRGQEEQEASVVPPRLLSAEEVATILGVPVKTLYQWRYKGAGPAGVRVGRHLRYRTADIEAWIEGRIAEDRRPRVG
jgi:excisionase family DNA binding protein